MTIKNKNPLKKIELKNKILNKNVFTFIHEIPHNTYDLIIIDPPYNLSKRFNLNNFSKMKEEQYAEYINSFVEPCKNILKETGSIYICCDWSSSYIIQSILAKYFIIKSRITWKRDKGRASKTNFKNNLEDIFYCVNSKNHTFNQVKIKKKVIAPYKDKNGARGWFEENGKKFRLTACGNFMDNITIPFWSMPENTPHPTQKPEKLIAKLVWTSTNKNDFILDLFAGSGTTSSVAVKMQRNFTAIENDRGYLQIIKKRLKMAKNNNNIQGYIDNGCFLERNHNIKNDKSI